MTVQSTAPTSRRRISPAEAGEPVSQAQVSGIARVFCTLLFWVFAIGMALELPLGSSSPQGSRSAQSLEIQESLHADASGLVVPEEDEDWQEPAQSDAAPAPFDAAVIHDAAAGPPEQDAADLLAHRDDAVSSRTSVAWASARAPPFLSLC